MAAAILPLTLAIAHHLLVFALLGVLVAERTLVGGQLAPRRIRQLGRLDAIYGLLAVGILVFTPRPDDVRRVGRFLSAELIIFPLIPAFAAAMAMGYGLP